MSQIYLLAVPTVVATYSNVIGRFVIMSTVVFLTVLCLLFFLVFPKVFDFRFLSSGSSDDDESRDFLYAKSISGKQSIKGTSPVAQQTNKLVNETIREVTATKISLSSMPQLDDI